MKRFEVEYYEKENGECPAKEFIERLDMKMQAKFIVLLEILEERGNDLREPYSKHLDEGIFEIRCKVGNNIARVLYFFYYQGKIVLTNGFIKKTQKIPSDELRIAKMRRKEYVERMEREWRR